MSDESTPKVSGRPGGGAYPNGAPDYMQALSLGRTGAADDSEERREMRLNRRVAAQKNAAMGVGSYGRGGVDVSFATGRPRDPMFYWKQNNLPYEVDKPEEMVKIRAYCRVLYLTHPVIASAIDVYSKYPLTGLELTCKDDALTEFYTTLFFDQLDYGEYLIDVGREHWLTGEAWPLGSFNETLGVWEEDELINPDDVRVIRSPFLKEPRFEMRLPEVLRDIITKRSPRWEFEQLMRSYPELANYVGEEATMPVSNVLLKQLRFKADTFNPRGIPILMRAFRSIMQEEMMNAATDAIADRLYTPLILAKLGASATDLGTTEPWIPTEDDRADFEEALDAALAGDFRVLIHHFAVEMETVFGREQMPDMTSDFDRLTDRILQTFGLSKTMLSGAGQGETYAADAMNRDLVSQLLTTYQRKLQRFFKERALVVAEAQEHYDYEERGGKRYPIMEEVLEVDEETGEQRIVEQPKLLVPELKIKEMTMKSEQDQRQFVEAMIAAGVPISMKTRLMNIPIDLKEEIEEKREEVVNLAVEEQETRKATFEALRAANLPIPEDLKRDFEPKAMGSGQTPPELSRGQQPLTPEEQAAQALADAIPVLGTEPHVNPNLAPAVVESSPDGQGGAKILPLPTNQIMDRTRPPESDEMRAGMPRPAARRVEAAWQAWQTKATLEDGSYGPPEPVAVTEEHWSNHSSLLDGPSHMGMRRQSGLTKDTPLPGWEDGGDEEAAG